MKKRKKTKKLKIFKIIGHILSILVTVILALLLCANLYTILTKNLLGISQPSIFGFSAAVVISGSMSPEIEVNDVVIIRSTGDYAVGDTVTYESGGTLITHRIIDVTERGYITQGDANNAPDIDIPTDSEVVGEVVAVIPKVGIFIEFLHTPFGMTVLILCGMLMLLLPSVPEIFGKRRNRRNRRF